jgi:hypothetical protein
MLKGIKGKICFGYAAARFAASVFASTVMSTANE